MKQKQRTKQAPKNRMPEPRYKWEKGAYRRIQDRRITYPWQFLYLCKLCAITPDDVLNQFLSDMGQESFKRSNNPQVRQITIEYFIQRGYGQDFYTEQDIRKMFGELDAIGSLWPQDANMKLIDRHAKWRNKYQDYWFKKWYYKVRRRKP
jgi:hypothetical protein